MLHRWLYLAATVCSALMVAAGYMGDQMLERAFLALMCLIMGWAGGAALWRRA
jgi:hypothetical protein